MVGTCSRIKAGCVSSSRYVNMVFLMTDSSVCGELPTVDLTTTNKKCVVQLKL